MRQAQVQPQFVEGGVGFPQVLLPGCAALALGIEQRLLKIQRGIHQPLHDGAPIHAR